MENLIDTIEGKCRITRSESLLRSGLYSDLTLQLTDPITKKSEEIKVHKCILSTVSPVWTTSIKWKEDILVIDGYSKAVVDCILIFAYTDTVKFESTDFCFEVMHAADFYDIIKLVSLCENYIKNILLTKQMAVDEFVKIFNKISTMGLENLIDICFGYIQDNAKVFFESDEFFDLNQDSIVLIAVVDKYLCSEKDLIRSVLKWTIRNMQHTSLRTFLMECNILKVLRFPILNIEDSVQLFEDYPDLFNGDEKFNIIRLRVSKKPFQIDFINPDLKLPRGQGNHDRDKEIIVGDPPMIILESFSYSGNPTSIPVFSIELEPRTNQMVPSCKLDYEEDVSINVPGYSMSFNGITSRSVDTVVNMKNPIQILVQTKSSFQMEIILRRPGIYKKSKFICESYKGLTREKIGIIKNIIHHAKRDRLTQSENLTIEVTQ